MSVTSVVLHSLADTAALAARIAVQLKPGDVVALSGDLGTGKTAFARALIHALSGKEVTVNSPTFTLLQTYPTPRGEVWHYDLYRIENASALAELGLEEALGHITLIEWPERLGSYRLPVSHRLRFTLQDDGSRSVTLDVIPAKAGI